MSGKTNIDEVTLDFITVFKRIKDKRRSIHMDSRREELLRREKGKRGRRDKISR